MTARGRGAGTPDREGSLVLATGCTFNAGVHTYAPIAMQRRTSAVDPTPDKREPPKKQKTTQKAPRKQNKTYLPQLSATRVIKKERAREREKERKRESDRAAKERERARGRERERKRERGRERELARARVRERASKGWRLTSSS